MIAPAAVFNRLKARGAGLFAGVPDSLLQSFCAYVEEHGGAKEHLITANEGNAVAVAMGHHLATGQIPVVYMQNSGLGNAVNPLASLADPEVYRVPMLLVIGWRGEPGVKDEPQHVKQGQVTTGQLNLLGIPYWILDATTKAESVVDLVMDRIRDSNAPAALLVRKGAFAPHAAPARAARSASLTREDALEELLRLAGDALVVATTGKTSREVFELRERAGQPQRDFLTVGGMGHASSIALGVAMGAPGRCVVCLDGDGAALMHLGAMPIIGDVAPANLVHVLLNNSAHESVGGQPTVADAVDFKAIGLACGYRKFLYANDLAQVRSCWREVEAANGPVLLQVDIAVGSRADLGRPTSTPEQNKLAFIEAVR
ncbi:MAG: phosphonopyruvate decarboxylase [Pseudomonadota bacterium]|nr:phosphonopyruvate decarboxylase [Pseudomonadota bacterium]